MIDANIYLEFFRFSKDDIEELRKLVELIRNQELVLYLSDQLRDEFRRNREKVLALSFKAVADATKAAPFPQVLRNYHEFAKLDSVRKDYFARVDKLLTRAKRDAAERRLAADSLIQELFGLATFLEVSTATVESAKDRYSRGNPPGKNQSYGDAITWQTLLDEHPHGQPLDVITNDADWVSPLREGRLHEFLEDEWTTLKASHLDVFDTLTSFFHGHYPDIRLSTEVASEVAVARLEQSRSFADTHAAIAILRDIPDFSQQQIERLVTTGLQNGQVAYILHDDDVREFYLQLYETYGDELDAETYSDLGNIIA